MIEDTRKRRGRTGEIYHLVLPYPYSRNEGKKGRGRGVPIDRGTGELKGEEGTVSPCENIFLDEGEKAWAGHYNALKKGG